jgi:hypothetical protein
MDLPNWCQLNYFMISATLICCTIKVLAYEKLQNMAKLKFDEARLNIN